MGLSTCPLKFARKMMEEVNDEQPEIVTHEEVALAEREAMQTSTATPRKDQRSTPSIPAPSPLPSFFASHGAISAEVSSPVSGNSGSPPPTSPSKSEEKAPGLVTPGRGEAPGPMQTPFEASSAIPVSSAPESQALPSLGASQVRGLFEWFSNSNLVHKVVERTRNSVETVITTLDPGMREVIRSGSGIEIMVTSTKENKVAPVREAFQETFSRVRVTGVESQSTTAAQPLGFAAGLKGAEDRIKSLRESRAISDDVTAVSIEGFIVEMFPDRWFEMSCLVLKDPVNQIELETCSQPTPIPIQYILAAQDRTPADYPLRWAGLAVTIGQIIEEDQPHIGRADWQKVLSGVPRRDSLYLAAATLAYMYKQRLPTSFIS
ncbi:hypothetical protein C0Q70_20516 [Pomacea canaliculata]|uniref:Non-canonical purine NTP phosphatase/PRRC1 domain-containing protein n=1 Tax=Pomacea canaliculata TaxID=400727 RepID=A0A2T7NFW6_POMCA|nr:hypothetical protein C0Q70_20516 [Pomacea canaliculata]